MFNTITTLALAIGQRAYELRADLAKLRDTDCPEMAAVVADLMRAGASIEKARGHFDKALAEQDGKTR